ncbi:DUF4097 family beta strand repeat-containing protein [Paenibacillus sp. J2TS4]|uniref:DUF4097 family beta strand repeat-containing protein n=1 Tax=Paenibacillus sp. J2TS4 TaxID=2807194 RepID=UPI001B297785|nr:DUF4097 family beta strand repeat-containing protein [Paenibacillus sp. J2TS4]GIP33825.1 hypothetical protein J2TS4_30350 [Paenibacillus sp. J2TS4]
MIRKWLVWLGLLGGLLAIGGILAINSIWVKTMDVRHTASAQSLDKISLKSTFLTLHLHSSDDDQIYAHLRGRTTKLSEPELQLSTEGNRLVVEAVEKNPGISALGPRNTLALHVYLPDNRFSEITMDNVFGKIILHSPMEADRLQIKNALGKVWLSGFQGHELFVHTELGPITIDSLHASAADIRSNAGDIVIGQWDEMDGNNIVQTTRGSIQVGVGMLPESLNISLISNGYVTTDLGIGRYEGTHEDWRTWGIRSIQGYYGDARPDTPRLRIKSDTGKIVANKL